MISLDSPTIIECDDLSLHFKENSKAVIFWDACGILDILNLIVESTNSTFLSILLKLTEQINNKEIISCSSIIVRQEIIDNYQKPPYLQAKKFIDDTIRNYNKIQSYLKELGQIDSAEEVFTNSEAFLNIVEIQIKTILDNTVFINDDTFLKNARDRVVTKTAPSQKNEFKDSVIWETCIYTSRKSSLDLYFVSSNESDYGKKGDRFSKIKEDIEENNVNFKHKIIELYELVNNVV